MLDGVKTGRASSWDNVALSDAKVQRPRRVLLNVSVVWAPGPALQRFPHRNPDLYTGHMQGLCRRVCNSRKLQTV